MECTHCDNELEFNCDWGYLASHQSGEVLGQIYTCNNSYEFETEDAALEYLEKIGENLITLGLDTWEDVTCGSAIHSVPGSFYTDKSGNLQEGYPC